MLDGLAQIAKFAGVGGLAVAVLLLLGRSFVSGRLLRKLSSNQSFTVMVALLASTTTLGIAGLALWGWLAWISAPPNSASARQPASSHAISVGAQAAHSIQNAGTINNNPAPSPSPVSLERTVTPEALVFDQTLPIVHLRRAWPQYVPGRASLACVVSVDNVLNCNVNTAEPRSFGTAALKLFHGRRVGRLGTNGELVSGRRVVIPVEFGGDWDTLEWEGTEFEDVRKPVEQ